MKKLLQILICFSISSFGLYANAAGADPYTSEQVEEVIKWLEDAVAKYPESLRSRIENKILTPERLDKADRSLRIVKIAFKKLAKNKKVIAAATAKIATEAGVAVGTASAVSISVAVGAGAIIAYGVCENNWTPHCDEVGEYWVERLGNR